MKDSNQMADSFFNLSSLKNGEHILPSDDEDCLENEEAYDALNDETFGDLEENFSEEDWEQQHEQFAEFAKSSGKDDEEIDLIDLSLSDNIPNPLPLTGSSVWSYNPPNTKKNGEIATNAPARGLVQQDSTDLLHAFDKAKSLLPPTSSLLGAPKICTVEELEKSLLKNTNAVQQPLSSPLHQFPSRSPHLLKINGGKNAISVPPPPMPPPHLQRPMPFPPNQPHPPHHMFPSPHRPPNFHGHPYPIPPPGPNRFPPGIPPPIGMRHMPPPGFRMMPPHPFLQGNMSAPRPHMGMHLPYQMNPQGVVPNFPRNIPMMHQQGNNWNPMHSQNQQRQRCYSGRSDSDHGTPRDEYEGLMTTKEKQWLLNIQMLQLNTGTPYFDDYYYTVFKERKSKTGKENPQIEMFKYQNNRQRRNSDRQDNPPTPRVYTPLQFENSLGKLQLGSVTAPRKIIDMDVVSCDKDADVAAQSSKETRKTKQLLLELEALYTLFLKAEDLTNPVAISNLNVLRDIKQKQRLRELETATTAEQKQELLELVKKESEPVVENPNDYMQRILSSLLQEDKFTGFMGVRKGKMLLLRFLPTLNNEQFFPQIVEIWSKLLHSIPIVGRRDTLGDNSLPKFYPLFKRYIQSVTISDILENVSGLTEVPKLENSRSTPLGHQAKSRLYFLIINKFGISAITALFVRSEYLLSTNHVAEEQQSAWFNFVISVADLVVQIPKVSTPLEGISPATFKKFCQRIPNLTPDKVIVLSKYFVDAED